ncbi:DUF1838 domain-containing protein [Mumia quercus]|uniref:DUF1838 domain-containing protein n=1 Tax=Mumia quercus TaxID=2976125 RepID=UPI0021D2367C|nr:DUF1838 domain-containing protein [Mumia quercus]
MTDPVPLDLAGSPRDNLYAFGKTWGTFGENPLISTFHGTMYASIGTSRLQPLFGYAGTGITKVRFVGEGSDERLQMRGKETGFFYDLRTGDVIETWDNPFTGETVEVFPFLNDKIGGELTLQMPRLFVGDAEEHGIAMNENVEAAADGSLPFLLPWAVYGDEVLLEWDYAHEYPNPVTPLGWPKSSTGHTINPSEHFVIYTSKRELEDRDLASAHFRAGFSRVSPFWPWMRMGGSGLEGGVMTGRLHSRKTIRGLDDVPPKIRAYTEKHHPEYFEAPEGWDVSGPILSSWEAYARAVPQEA